MAVCIQEAYGSLIAVLLQSYCSLIAVLLQSYCSLIAVLLQSYCSLVADNRFLRLSKSLRGQDSLKVIYESMLVPVSLLRKAQRLKPSNLFRSYEKGSKTSSVSFITCRKALLSRKNFKQSTIKAASRQERIISELRHTCSWELSLFFNSPLLSCTICACIDTIKEIRSWKHWVCLISS
jgi:hypothetical protein